MKRRLTDEQRILVEENLGLIRTILGNPPLSTRFPGLQNDPDAFQIAAIALASAISCPTRETRTADEEPTEGKGTLATYAGQAIVNLIIHEFARKRRWQIQPLTGTDEDETHPEIVDAAAVDPAEEAASRVDRSRVWELMSRANLTETERAVIVGRFWHSRTHEDIGADLGIGRTAVNQIESRAMRKLRGVKDVS